MEWAERELEVYGVVRLGRLNVVTVKDEVDRERGPDLRPGVGNNREADCVIVEANPSNLFERVQSGNKLCHKPKKKSVRNSITVGGISIIRFACLAIAPYLRMSEYS